MPAPITILIVDDHSVVRQGVRAFLDLQLDLRVVGLADSGEAALPLVQLLAPDIVILDVKLPGMSGIDATRQIKALHPQTQIIILTSFFEAEHIVAALRAGAITYTLKDILSQDLVDIVHAAARGESVLHPRVAAQLIREVREARRPVPPAFGELTEREFEVLRLIALGATNADIATKLVLSEKTVKNHVSSILSKLHLVDRTKAAVFAWQQGLMESG